MGEKTLDRAKLLEAYKSCFEHASAMMHTAMHHALASEDYEGLPEEEVEEFKGRVAVFIEATKPCEDATEDVA